MELRQIRQFLAVEACGSITQASIEVGISQPALTQSIRKLEDALGGALLIRNRNGCHLTALGQQMLTKFREIDEQARQAEEEALRFVRLKQVPIRVGAETTIGFDRLSHPIAAFQTRHREFELEMVVGEIDNLREGLESGFLDLAIVSDGQFPEETFRADRLYDEGYVLVFRPDHRFASAEKVGLSDLVEETLLDRPNCEMRDQLLELFATNKIPLYAPHRSNSDSWLRYQIKEGIGIAVLPEYTVDLQDMALRTRPLGLPGFGRQIVAARSRFQPSRMQTQKLIDDLGAALKSSRPGQHRDSG